MIKIYHNPRCRKSREGLQILEESGKDFEIVKYLENTPTKEELSDIIKLLGIKPIDLVRKNESIWKENYKNKQLSDNEIITAMVENPKLIERPIVVNKNKAIIGRPPENIKKII
ncbi:arsenate reductase [Mesoflavibacter sabulilitoris]|uniref:Arsenate reductase (Glutaredoxin) n=1 Tax=Mesoflavibacter zeaxanthinifaciens subsp. sabulilitoris TaxID=1520893 RepID=A0A2T1NGW7_9FLAO|nr:arsenate reductase (glutaredoxin) [Mesoflavibacter zeaxanthinifaciens]MBB3122850.1 arsenate reductase [Mesoflavibacter zeaxanthinifaciens subsp. sabulilitoris]PSG92070.1 arsenate reductase (glutaredoxin) [Mesoflavibacter zeaxanthinifaciens subsp. sabulilitoris]